jgi:hypothetical protein
MVSSMARSWTSGRSIGPELSCNVRKCPALKISASPSPGGFAAGRGDLELPATIMVVLSEW